jgi:exosome complex RNA-binding protein Csl4
VRAVRLGRRRDVKDKPCTINGKPATVDEAAKHIADVLLAGGKISVLIAPCSRCGCRVGYLNRPNWMNRWTCPQCGRHEPR